MTVTEIHPEYRAELERLATAQRLGEEQTDRLPQAIRALDAPAQESLRWIVDGLWPAALLGLLVGDGGAFKSSAAIHIGGAVAGGYPVFDRYPSVRRPVMIISAEDEIDVILMRLEAFIEGHQWDRERVMENVHIIASDEASLGSADWLTHIRREAERIEPGFMVFDPWAELLGGDENSNTDARPAIKYLRRLGKHVDSAVCVVHHAGKAGDGTKRTLDRIRGASALPSASRVIMFFEFQPDSVRVENLKMSRAARLEPFVIKREIHSLPENRAQWTSAKLTTESAARYELSRPVAPSKAKQFVCAQLTMAAPRRLKAGDLKTLAKGIPGIRGGDLAAATAELYRDGVIGLFGGKQGAKEWYWIGGSASQRRGNDDGSDPSDAQSDLPLAPENGVGTALERVERPPDPEPFQPFQSRSRAVPEAARKPFPPLKGGNDSPPSASGWNGSQIEELTEDEIQALIDEQLGKREADES